MLDQDDTGRRRQDLLEAITVGMTGPGFGPMPGSIFETLEIAAASRSERRALWRQAAPAPLTAAANGSPMTAILLRIGGAVGNVAFRIKAGSGARRLPV